MLQEEREREREGEEGRNYPFEILHELLPRLGQHKSVKLKLEMSWNFFYFTPQQILVREI